MYKRCQLTVTLVLLSTCFFLSGHAFAAEKKGVKPEEQVWLVRDWNGKNTAYLINFRTMGVAFGVPTREKVPQPSREGLSALRVSASGQPSAVTLNELKRMMKGYRLFVLDLREEPHGFINGLPVSWYRGENDLERGKLPAEIESDERSRLLSLEKEKYVDTYLLSWRKGDVQMRRTGSNPVRMTVDEARSERNLAALLGVGYARIPVPDYSVPSDGNVDSFVALVNSLDENVWMHVHCDSGRVRTTTFLAMLDMMQNAGKVSLEDIVNRQWLMGGINLFKGEASLFFADPLAKERSAFMREFYVYCREAGPSFNESWTSWSMRRRSGTGAGR